MQLEDSSWIFSKEINWKLIDVKGRTNIERVKGGLAPIDEAGKSYELHHMGQKSDAPLVILTNAEHHSKTNYSILHYGEKGKDIADEVWNKQRKSTWSKVMELQLAA